MTKPQNVTDLLRLLATREIVVPASEDGHAEREFMLTLLGDLGFTKVKIVYRPEWPKMMRWYCKIGGVFAPTLSGRVNGWGDTARASLMGALACKPQLLKPGEEDEEE